MPIAYYMKFEIGHKGSKNRIGGQPTFISKKSWPKEDDEYYGFLMELWVDGVRLSIPNTICLQIFQSIDEGDDPTPIAIPIPPNCRKREENDKLIIHPNAREYDIHFEPVEEPDELPKYGIELAPYFKSKLGGLDPWERDIKGRRFLGQIHEQPLDFNFGGKVASIYEDNNGIIIVELN